jgi:hypothetical protein
MDRLFRSKPWRRSALYALFGCLLCVAIPRTVLADPMHGQEDTDFAYCSQCNCCRNTMCTGYHGGWTGGVCADGFIDCVHHIGVSCDN